MRDSDDCSEFTATHHALLFAWLSRAVVRRVGEARGEAVMRHAVRRYGEQRGRRMALRVEAEGHSLSMANYMTYGEWSVGEGEMAKQVLGVAPDAISHVTRCSWHTAWTRHNLMAYGRFYCLEIDEALVRGYNPALTLEVHGTMTSGAEHCEFVYRGAGLTQPDPPSKSPVMPWEYHCGHLLKTVSKAVTDDLGEVGAEVIEEAMAAFTERYGADATEIVGSFSATDFCRLPH